jgi:hypothetical protein
MKEIRKEVIDNRYIQSLREEMMQLEGKRTDNNGVPFISFYRSSSLTS